MMTFHLDIVSAEEAIFSGRVARLFVRGVMGALEVVPMHSPLLTVLLPGPVRLKHQDGSNEIIYVSGGILEVQPEVVTLLADTVKREQEFNEAEALKAKEQAMQYLQGKHTPLEYAQARAELSRAAGMLRAIKEIQHYIK
jgi:F-type H+-transporting ATPase subunit epsilon